jgi:DNA transposition AAA+ family ATPase
MIAQLVIFMPLLGLKIDRLITRLMQRLLMLLMTQEAVGHTYDALEIIIRAESPVRYVCHFEKVAR